MTLLHGNIDCNSASNIEFATDLNPPRLQKAVERVKQLIADILMENADIAVGPQVEFQRLAFQDQFVGDVRDIKCGKVGLSCNRTKAGKLITMESDDGVASRVGVRKGLELACGLGRSASQLR